MPISEVEFLVMIRFDFTLLALFFGGIKHKKSIRRGECFFEIEYISKIRSF
jgi:hypothetical protein